MGVVRLLKINQLAYIGTRVAFNMRSCFFTKARLISLQLVESAYRHLEPT